MLNEVKETNTIGSLLSEVLRVVRFLWAESRKENGKFKLVGIELQSGKTRKFRKQMVVTVIHIVNVSSAMGQHT